MKTLNTVSAAIELGAGLTLMVFPSVVVKLRLGAPLAAPAAVLLGRLTGAALFALGISCWLARGAAPNRAAKGVVAAMLFYNLGAVAVFLLAALVEKLAGVALWPAAILHAVMAVWCARVLWVSGNSGSQSTGDSNQITT